MGLYINTYKTTKLHGGMKFKCDKCGKSWWMFLEIGVEDRGRNGKAHQPCPSTIPCECGGTALDVSGYLPLDEIKTAEPGMKLFAYDKSGKRDACGKMAIYRSLCYGGGVI